MLSAPWKSRYMAILDPTSDAGLEAVTVQKLGGRGQAALRVLPLQHQAAALYKKLVDANPPPTRWAV